MKNPAAANRARLTRSRTSDSSSSKSSTSAPHDIPDAPICTSIEDLRTPEARQQLRQQLTGTFPETARRSPRQAIKGSSMGFKDRLSRRGSRVDYDNHPSPQGSTSTINSTQAVERESTVPESGNAPGSTESIVDIEQAIRLLQELKKTASPDDLVALHRALLPTRERDSVVSQQGSAFDAQTASTSPLARRRSVLPPGLATRGGVSEDLLRKPGELLSDSKKKSVETGSWFDHARSVPVSPGTAASDLAGGVHHNVDNHTPPTSDLAYSHIGAYSHGTLRVTNGAASPEPSIRNFLIQDQIMPAKVCTHEDGLDAAMQARPSLEVLHGRSSLDDAHMRDVPEALSVRDRIMKSNKAQQQRIQRAHRLSGQSSAESLSSHTQIHIQTSISRQNDISRGSSVSPMSAELSIPRFQQRWSHRASQISQEDVSDCETSAVPYEEKTALLNFASRLSTVYDSDPEDADMTAESPQAALSKLEGSDQLVNAHITAGPAVPVHEHVTSKPVDEDERPMPPSKGDSGYESDISNITPARSNASRHDQLVTINGATNGVDEHGATASDDDSKSLYTCKEVLSLPSLLSETKPKIPRRPVPKKQTPALLPFLNIRKTSMPTTEREMSHSSTDTIATMASTQSSPADSQRSEYFSKQQKRLQKPIPKTVKEARKAEIRKQRELIVDTQGDAKPIQPFNIATASASFSEGQGSTQIFLVPKASIAAEPPTSINPEPAELSGDSSCGAPSPVVRDDRRSSSRARSKSRGRNRNSANPEGSTDTTAESTKRWSIPRKQDKSRSRSRGHAPKRSCSGKEAETAFEKADRDADHLGEDFIPPYSDFGSMARTLGSSAYDISTNQFKRLIGPVPSAAQHQLQPPYLISTGLIKTQYVAGMDANAASELARMKSRDVAANSTAPGYGRPRRATPKSRRASGSSQSAVSSEDRFRDWQSRTTAGMEKQRRPQSMYAESIPPLPELPADAAVKALKADEMVAKMLIKDGATSTPAALDRHRAHGSEDHNADAMKNALLARQAQDKKTVLDEQALQLLHPAIRSAAKREISVEVRELSECGSERSSEVDNNSQTQQIRPTSAETEHPGWPGWEQQARLWRERRESAGVTLGRPIRLEEETFTAAETPPLSREPSDSPAIVVSRYITPLSCANAANASLRPTDTAAQHASAYRTLLGDDKENRPAQDDISRTSSALTTTTATSTFVTLHTFDPRPAKQDVPRFDSAFSTDSYQSYQSTVASSISRARSPGGRVRTLSGNFVPYSPSHAARAERSRALSLAKLNGFANTSSTSLAETGITKHKNKSQDSLLDRYSGGLGYGWERGVGFAESAGTRHNASSLAKRKSAVMSESFGLDLSDVPVFLLK